MQIYNVAEIYNAEETAATEPAFHCDGKMNVAENEREKNIGVKNIPVKEKRVARTKDL